VALLVGFPILFGLSVGTRAQDEFGFGLPDDTRIVLQLPLVALFTTTGLCLLLMARWKSLGAAPQTRRALACVAVAAAVMLADLASLGLLAGAALPPTSARVASPADAPGLAGVTRQAPLTPSLPAAARVSSSP
jgi:hypothetical protein